MWMMIVVALAGAADPGPTLPAPVRATVERMWPEARVTGVESGHAGLEIDVLDGDRAFSALFQEDGALLATEEEIDPETLPGPVRVAAVKLGRIGEAERRTLADGTELYEVELRGKGHREVLLDANGAVVSDGEDEEGEDDDED